MSWSHLTQKQAIITAFTRKAALMFDLTQQMEQELKWMRQKGTISQELINKKDLQIEEIVTFYNQADETIQFLKHEIAQLHIENHFLTEMLLKKCTADEVICYKPTSKLIIDKLEETDLPQTLSDING